MKGLTGTDTAGWSWGLTLMPATGEALNNWEGETTQPVGVSHPLPSHLIVHGGKGGSHEESIQQSVAFDTTGWPTFSCMPVVSWSFLSPALLITALTPVSLELHSLKKQWDTSLCFRVCFPGDLG